MNNVQSFLYSMNLFLAFLTFEVVFFKNLGLFVYLVKLAIFVSGISIHDLNKVRKKSCKNISQIKKVQGASHSEYKKKLSVSINFTKIYQKLTNSMHLFLP